MPADALDRNHHEIFRFLWNHRGALAIPDDAHIAVESVNPVRKTDARGFPIREVVATYSKTLVLRAGELDWMSPPIVKPAAMPDSQPVTLAGGGTLIFDEHSRLKYDIRCSLRDSKRQSARLQHLWDAGHFDSTNPELA